jgi:hypothetical protein
MSKLTKGILCLLGFGFGCFNIGIYTTCQFKGIDSPVSPNGQIESIRWIIGVIIPLFLLVIGIGYIKNSND